MVTELLFRWIILLHFYIFPFWVIWLFPHLVVYLSIDLLSADKCTILHNGQCGANHLATHLHHYYNTAVYEKGSNSCICFRSILLSGGGQVLSGFEVLTKEKIVDLVHWGWVVFLTYLLLPSPPPYLVLPLHIPLIHLIFNTPYKLVNILVFLFLWSIELCILKPASLNYVVPSKYPATIKFRNYFLWKTKIESIFETSNQPQYLKIYFLLNTLFGLSIFVEKSCVYDIIKSRVSELTLVKIDIWDIRGWRAPQSATKPSQFLDNNPWFTNMYDVIGLYNLAQDIKISVNLGLVESRRRGSWVYTITIYLMLQALGIVMVRIGSNFMFLFIRKYSSIRSTSTTVCISMSVSRQIGGIKKHNK